MGSKDDSKRVVCGPIQKVPEKLQIVSLFQLVVQNFERSISRTSSTKGRVQKKTRLSRKNTNVRVFERSFSRTSSMRARLVHGRVVQFPIFSEGSIFFVNFQDFRKVRNVRLFLTTQGRMIFAVQNDNSLDALISYGQPYLTGSRG